MTTGGSRPSRPSDRRGGRARTPGLLRTRTADLERLAAVPEIRPPLDVVHWDKRLLAFGHVLLERGRRRRPAADGPQARLDQDRALLMQRPESAAVAARRALHRGITWHTTPMTEGVLMFKGRACPAARSALGFDTATSGRSFNCLRLRDDRRIRRMRLCTTCSKKARGAASPPLLQLTWSNHSRLMEIRRESTTATGIGGR